MDHLGVEVKKDTHTRVSVSEPLSAPPGHKVLATAMEIGLVRDVMDKTLTLHDVLINNQSVVGRAYSLWFGAVCKGLSISDVTRKTSQKIFIERFPEVIVQKTLDAHLAVWHKWVNVDEAFSSKVSDQLQHHPFIRKTSYEILQDFERQIEETKVWKISKTVTDKILAIIRKIRELKDGADPKDKEESNTNEEPKSASKSEKKKTRGTTKGSQVASEESVSEG